MTTHLERGSTAVPPGFCLTHGAFVGAVCPGCSTAVPFQATDPSVYSTPPLRPATEPRTTMTTDTALVTRIYVEGGHYVRASEEIDTVAMLAANARTGDGWIVVLDPGTGCEKYVLVSRVLWLEQEPEDA